MSQDRTIYVQYCDDIRQEINGKYSLMGCYGHEMTLSPLPTAIPKFCAQVVIETPRERPFEKLAIRAYLNEVQFYELVHPHDVLKKGQASIKFDEQSLGIIRLGFMLTFAPLVISEPASLRVEAETEDEILKGHPLRIRAQAET